MNRHSRGWGLSAALVLSVFAGFTHFNSAARAASTSSNVQWLLNGPALSVLAADTTANRFLTGTGPFILQKSGDPLVPPSWKAKPVRSFTSYAHLKRAFENGAIDSTVRAILYDNEGWQFTPEAEQRDPANYTRLAAQIVHAHRLLFIAAPAVSITRLVAPNAPQRYEAYLQLHVAADSARYADVYNIQAQGSERNTERYTSFVQRSAEQARAANPHVVVLAGVSTNPSGQRVTADDVLGAIDATRSTVDGYWFNIPKPGPYCPGCNDFRPDLAIDVFKRLLPAM